MIVKHIVGTMSGSSLDGLDIAYCEWQGDRYRTIDSTVVDIPDALRAGITAFETMTPYQLLRLDKAVAHFMASAVSDFLEQHKQHTPDLLVSHGHTLLHHPEEGLSLQIGCGATLASLTGIDVLTDLRMQDIALGGQGAPLAAVMDVELLSEYAYCLNLGGIGNLTVNGKKALSWDICAVNQVLNHLAGELGLSYDEDGRIAQSGRLVETWYQALQRLPYYDQPPPKSLGNGWVRDQVIATIPHIDCTIADKLHTYVQFIIDQITEQIRRYSHGLTGTMLVTGGGAHNAYLMDMLTSRLASIDITVVKPHDQMIDYKEAILMTYIGARYMDGLSTTIPAITGATKPVVGGALYKAPL